jgi:hypothetical protein
MDSGFLEDEIQKHYHLPCMHSNDPQKNHENELQAVDLNIGITTVQQTEAEPLLETVFFFSSL